MNTANLTGARLNYWVARAAKLPLSDAWACGYAPSIMIGEGCGDLKPYNPQADWSDAGPIITREKLMIQPKLARDGDFYGTWRAVALSFEGRTHSDVEGSSPLVAAMRCYVASVFGLKLPPIPR